MKNILMILFIPSLFYCQQFGIEPLITIPGNNYNFDCMQFYPDSYITWINKSGSVYTVFLKRIAPTESENITVSTGYTEKSNPQFIWNKIAWENKINSKWEILLSYVESNSIKEPICIEDSIPNEPQMSLNNNRIVWNNKGTIFLKELADLSAPMIING